MRLAAAQFARINKLDSMAMHYGIVYDAENYTFYSTLINQLDSFAMHDIAIYGIVYGTKQYIVQYLV